MENRFRLQLTHNDGSPYTPDEIFAQLPSTKLIKIKRILSLILYPAAFFISGFAIWQLFWGSGDYKIHLRMAILVTICIFGLYLFFTFFTRYIVACQTEESEILQKVTEILNSIAKEEMDRTKINSYSNEDDSLEIHFIPVNKDE